MNNRLQPLRSVTHALNNREMFCQHCGQPFKRKHVLQMYCSAPCKFEGQRINTRDLNRQLRVAILRCFTREELAELRSEIDRLLDDPNWTTKIL